MEFIALSLLCDNIFFVKALMQWRQIWEAMKRWNVNYSKRLKQWSNDAFNDGKEIEAMKCLTLHRIASSLHHFCCPALSSTPTAYCADFFWGGGGAVGKVPGRRWGWEELRGRISPLTAQNRQKTPSDSGVCVWLKNYLKQHFFDKNISYCKI
jgi:hypothetical protein